MNILVQRPPMWDEIVAAFHPGPGTIFCWGDVIYNPDDQAVSRHLVEHEKVHRDRQGGDPAAWWRRYIDDSRFRLSQEIPAHLAELRSMNRAERRLNLGLCARRLSSRLYGAIISFDDARAILKKGCVA